MMRNSASGITLVAKPHLEPASENLQIKALVRRQMNQSGNILMAALEPLSEDDFFGGGVNGVSPAWTVGHLGCVLDLFTSWIESRELIIEPWLHGIFNSLDIGKKSGTKADLVDRSRLSKPELLLLFRQAQVRALQLLEGSVAAEWEHATPANAPDTLPTEGAIWQSLGVHTFWHLGELSGCLPKFHGTYTLNTVAHYFYAPSISPAAAPRFGSSTP
jgi:hypothetical protein